MSACRIVDAKNDDNDKKASVHKLRDAFAELNQLQNEHKERIKSCDEDIEKYQKFKDDYLHLQKRLASLPDKTSHEVMVPIGSLAFMPGRLVHTNEITVLLGDNWFVERSAKQASAIASRRIRDVDEKKKSMESVRQLHQNWLKEAEELSQGNAGEQVEIVEGPFDEQEVQKSREDTKRMLKEHNKKLKEENKKEMKTKESSQKNTKKSKKRNNKENTLDTSAVTINVSEDITKKDDTNCEDRSHEELMKRLDQLYLQEQSNRELDSDTDDEDDEVEMHKDQNGRKINKIVEPGSKELLEESEDLTEESEDLTEESEDLTEESEDLTEESEDEEVECYENTEKETVSQKPRLKRRVSWADEKPPYERIIPDNNSEDIFRIQYIPSKEYKVDDEESCSGNQTEDSRMTVSNNINSPSDLYKVFSSGKSTCQSSCHETKEMAHDIGSSPRGILKNPSPKRSLQSQKVLTDEHGWRYATEYIEPVGEDLSDPIARPPTPPRYTQQTQLLEENSEDTHSLQPAFKYSVVARDDQESKEVDPLITTKTNDSSNPEPKKVSRFKASRMNKT